MSKLRIKKDDIVIVLPGSDKGKVGKALRMLADEGRAIVESMNVIARSTKSSAKTPQGGIARQRAPVHISNLSLIDPKSGKAIRISVKREGKEVVRIAKKLGEEIK